MPSASAGAADFWCAGCAGSNLGHVKFKVEIFRDKGMFVSIFSDSRGL